MNSRSNLKDVARVGETLRGNSPDVSLDILLESQYGSNHYFAHFTRSDRRPDHPPKGLEIDAQDPRNHHRPRTGPRRGLRAAPRRRDRPSRPRRESPCSPAPKGTGGGTPGGRGGDVFVVNNLNDAGPGSLRAAVEAKGPRIVVFGVAGLITLKTPLDIEHPYITIAGQPPPATASASAARACTSTPMT